MGFRELHPDDQIRVKHVSHFYDHIGLVIAHKIVSEKLLTSFMGESAKITWDILEPFILKERELFGPKTNGEYQMFFEDLVARVIENPPHEIRKKLCLRKYDLNPTYFKQFKRKLKCDIIRIRFIFR